MPGDWPMPGVEDAEEFLDRAPCGLLTTNPDGLILAVNQTFLDWTGFAREELVAKRLLDELLSLPARIYYETHQAPLLRIQGFVSELATDFVCRNGKLLPVFMSSAEERDDSGKALFVRTAIFSARDRRSYERQLLLERRRSEDAVKAKADFLAMFAHELRNPLGAAALQVHLMQRKGMAPQAEEALLRLRASLDKVMMLINNMLDVSKLDAGKLTVEDIPFGVGDVLNAVVHSQAAGAERKALGLRLELDPALPERVVGDPVKLDQVLTNLIGNAIKFTHEGSITLGAKLVRLDHGHARIHFWVRDTGIGIPPDRREVIFDEYVQADASVARRFGGTGLGLAISRKLVELQGGRLSLQSKEGVGSTFAFDLDLRVAPAASAAT